MSKARDLANLADSATGLATDSELSAAVAGIDLTNVQRIVPVDSNISVPNAPTSVSATVDSTKSTVSFVASTDNGGSTILGYTVISSPGSIKKSGTTSPIVITGLTNGTAYTFTVKAHNIAGSSTASTASSSVTPTAVVTADFLVVAGGGGGASRFGGGGGAGGYRYFTDISPLLYNTNYTVTVGAGGAGGQDAGLGQPGAQGNNSVFSTYTSAGGGLGAYLNMTPPTPPGAGGSGGGGGETSTSGGAGNTPSTSPSQGNNGGIGAPNYKGGGGGGSGGVGGNGTLTGSSGVAGDGGIGTANSITGSSVTYAAGGHGSKFEANTTGTTGGANTGNGGGAAGGGTNNGGAGGSGVVIIRVLTSLGTITIGAGLTGTTATDGSYKVTTITAGTGNISWAA
jgi:hypothetical protein